MTQAGQPPAQTATQVSVRAAPHRWRFFSAGGFDQVRLDTGEDFVHLKELDQKLWVALSCPSAGLECDNDTLKLIDRDGDAHIRAPELLAAIDWALERLKSADTLVTGGDLPLAALRDDTPEGIALLAAARQILKEQGKPEATHLSVSDTANMAQVFAGMPLNGDGLITEASAPESLRALVSQIIQCMGAPLDQSGQPALDQAIITGFYTEATALAAWRQRPQAQPDLLPLGEATMSGYALLQTLSDKIDDFFNRCRLAAFDPRATVCLSSTEDNLKALNPKNLATCGEEIASLPLAQIAMDARLPLQRGLNPAWEEPVQQLNDRVITPLLGPRESLERTDWQALKARFQAYATWQAQQPSNALSTLTDDLLASYAAGQGQAELAALIQADLALAPEAAALQDLDRLVRYVRDLAMLTNNFVAFRDFYTEQKSKGKAIFQAGTLYLDGRSCDLCIKVLDAGKHAALASLSGMYLAYCECQRQGQKMTIAAAFTAGDADQLMPGRNGVFYDRQGQDWDATITKIIEHPISIRQAFWAPYKKIVRLIAEQAQKFAAAKAKASDDLLTQSVAHASQKIDPSKPATPPSAFDVGKFAGIFAAIGLAVGALGTAVATVLSGFLGLKGWQMPLALLGIITLISGPSVALAFFKLRNRNLGPLLDANGWAVNTRARINIPFGSTLTQLAKLPQGAERALFDPYAEQATPWKLYFLLGAFLTLALFLLSGNT